MIEHMYISLEDEHYLASAFFSALPKSRWPEILEHFCQGIGFTYNDVSCELPCEDLGEEAADGGIAFYLFEDELLLDVDTFLTIVKKVCIEYLKTNKNEIEYVESLYEQLCRNARKWDVEGVHNSVSTSSRS